MCLCKIHHHMEGFNKRCNNKIIANGLKITIISDNDLNRFKVLLTFACFSTNVISNIIPEKKITVNTRARKKKSEIQLSLWDWIKMWLVWGFALWASEQEKLLAWQGNLLVLDDQTGIFLFPGILVHYF